MSSLAATKREIKVESVVELSREVAGTQSSEGRLVVRENLGPGIVREIGEDGEAGMVRVYWPMAVLETWVSPEDLEVRDPRVHLLVIYHSGPEGHHNPPVCKIVSGAGLYYNWTVEIIHGNVIRTVRSDGLAWTFDWYPVIERAHPRGTILEDALAEDEHAEALTVAELSVA
jgi:hypothetical protein